MNEANRVTVYNQELKEWEICTVNEVVAFSIPFILHCHIFGRKFDGGEAWKGTRFIRHFVYNDFKQHIVLKDTYNVETNKLYRSNGSNDLTNFSLAPVDENLIRNVGIFSPQEKLWLGWKCEQYKEEVVTEGAFGKCNSVADLIALAKKKGVV